MVTLKQYTAAGSDFGRKLPEVFGTLIAGKVAGTSTLPAGGARYVLRRS